MRHRKAKNVKARLAARVKQFESIPPKDRAGFYKPGSQNPHKGV